MFSRRRKSSTVKTAMTEPNVFDSVESRRVAKPKSGAEDGSAVSSGCLPLKQKRKRGQSSVTDSQFYIVLKRLN